jgi:hypothetical protein
MVNIGEMQVSEIEIVFSKPLSFEDSEDDYTAPNLLQRILSLFSNIRPGSDLSRFQIPPTFNIPKSHLQCYGESVYCIGEDLLSKCNKAESSVERLIAVVAWSISMMRPLVFGVAPYNPVLGETHHVSRGNLNVLLEQVCHHPPVTAMYATDEKENIEVRWCQTAIPKFLGASVEAQVQGERQLRLHKHGETYFMNSPNLLFRFLPSPGVDWVGNVKIHCEVTGLSADLCYKTTSFFGGNHRAIKGKIYSSKTLFEINGHWDRAVTIKDLKSGKSRIIYKAKEVISRLKAPTVKDLQGVSSNESAVVWREVNQSLFNKDWERAREAKKSVEEKQRQLVREREINGEKWVPKHFNVIFSKENNNGTWDCSPIHKKVPQAPIFVPL